MNLGFGRVIPKLLKIIPYNGKIADITHADTNKHFLDLAAALSENRKIISIIAGGIRVSGTGHIQCYSNEGTLETKVCYATTVPGISTQVIIADGTQRLEYSQSVANDDFDFYCYGYVVEA